MTITRLKACALMPFFVATISTFCLFAEKTGEKIVETTKGVYNDFKACKKHHEKVVGSLLGVNILERDYEVAKITAISMVTIASVLAVAIPCALWLSKKLVLWIFSKITG